MTENETDRDNPIRETFKKLNIRHMWVRLGLAGAAMAILTLILLLAADPNALSGRLVSSVPGISVVLAVMSTLVLVIMSHSVFGLRDRVRDQTRRVWELAWQAHEEFALSEGEAAQEIANKHIGQLLDLPLDQYHDPENYLGWKDNIDELLDKLREEPGAYRLMFRYLLPLESELNELSILYLRRRIARFHLRTLSESFVLVVIAICVVVLGTIFPGGRAISIVLANSALGVIVLSPLQLLVVLSYVRQEALEETIQPAQS